MKTAINNLIENNDPTRLIHLLDRMYKSLIAIAIALVVSIGWNAIQWQQNKTQDHKLGSQAATIIAIKNANHLAKLAAHKTCLQNRPRTQGLVGGLAEYFKEQKLTLQKLIKGTEKGTKLYVSRKETLTNYARIHAILASYLPITCQPNQHAKDAKGNGSSRG